MRAWGGRGRRVSRVAHARTACESAGIFTRRASTGVVKQSDGEMQLCMVLVACGWTVVLVGSVHLQNRQSTTDDHAEKRAANGDSGSNATCISFSTIALYIP